MQFEDKLNDASSAYEAQFYNYHVARIQKWIHISDNRITLYTQILADESVLEEFEKLHDGGYEVPSDIHGFQVRPMINLYKDVHRDKPRIKTPKEPEQNLSENSSPNSGNSNPTPTPPNSGHTTPQLGGNNTPDPDMANRWKYYRDIPKFTGAPCEMGATHLIKLGDMFKIFDIAVPNNPDDDAHDIIDLFKTSLNGPARNWYDLNVSGENMGERSVTDWETIKTKFLKYYNPAGSTIEQQMTTLDTLKWCPLTETIDQFAYKFQLMYKSSFGEDYTCAMFKKSLPNDYRERLMGVNTFNDVIQRVKEVQQFLGQNIPPPAQWPAYGMPQWPGTYPYPYGMMYPQQPSSMHPNQNPMGYQGVAAPFPPQGQSANSDQQKMNVMAAKSVSFAPQLETPITVSGVKDAVKDAFSDIAGEISFLKSQFLENKLKHIRDDISGLRTKDDLQDFLHYQTKAMNRTIEKLIDMVDRQNTEIERNKDKDRLRDRDRNEEYRNSYRGSYRNQDESRSSSGDRYSKSLNRSSDGYENYRNDIDRDYRRDRNTSRDRYDIPRPRNGSRVRYNPNIICRYCQRKGHIQAECPQLEKDLKMGHQIDKHMTLGNNQVEQAGQVMFMTEDSLDGLIRKIYKKLSN